MTHQARQEALERGHIKYQGKPCRHGHSGIRYVKDWTCIDCNAARVRTQRPGRNSRARTKARIGDKRSALRMSDDQILRRVGDEVNRLAGKPFIKPPTLAQLMAKR